MKVHRQKMVRFASRYVFIFAIGVAGWEAAHLARGDVFGITDLAEAAGLFIGISMLVIVSVSILRGWIEFGSPA